MIPPEDHLDIYVPGVLRCPLCNFELTSATLFVGSGEIGLTRRQALVEDVGEPCPNDGAPMVKVRWSERAQQNYEAYGSLMNEIITASGRGVTTGNLPAALNTVRALSALAAEFVRYWTTDRTPDGCGMCGGIPHSTTCYVGRMATLVGSGTEVSKEPVDSTHRSAAK